MKSCLQNNTCGNNSPKILVWQCKDGISYSCWGTGDRMRGIISSLVLGMLTDRVFLIDWPTQPFPLNNVIETSSLNWTVPSNLDTSSWPTANDHSWPLLRWERCQPKLLCVATQSLTYHQMKHDLKKKITISKRMNFSESTTYDELTKVDQFIIYSRSLNSYRGRLLHRPEWSRKYEDFRPGIFSPFQINRMLLKALFKPSAAVIEELQKIIPDDARNNGYVAIHARTGHDVGEGKIFRFSNLPSAPDILAGRILNCAEGRGLKQTDSIFFASDSSRVKKSFLRIAKSKNYTVHATKVSAIHIAANQSETRIGSFHRGNDEWFSFLNIFVEFFGISGGRYMIATRSEFSRLAFLLGNSRRPVRINLDCSTCDCR